MKHLSLIALTILILAPAAWGLDATTITQYEGSFAVLMGTEDPKALQTLEDQLAPTLATADAATQVKAGIVALNLSRALGSKGTKGFAAKASARLTGPAKGTDANLAALALPLLGTAQTLQGNEDANPAAKITFVNQGWATLGQGVDQYGEATWVPRFYRASVGQSLPDFFNKGPQVLADIQALKVWDQAHPGRMVPGILAQLALYEGNALKKAKNLDAAVAAWTRAVTLDPKKTGAGKAAAAALELYGE